MDRAGKTQFVEDLRRNISQAELLVLTSPNGLTVTESSDLRQKMRDAGASFKVVKNTLARIALEGTNFADLASKINGPIAFAYSTDPVAAAKAVMDFVNGNSKLSVVSGMLSGKSLSAKDVEGLAKLPSLDQLRGKLIGVIMAPAQQMVGVLNAPATQLTRVISAYSEKK